MQLTPADQDYIPTGLASLDREIIGLPRGNVTVLASQPGVGKSSLARQFVSHALEHEYSTVFLDLESSAQTIETRILSQRTTFPYTKLLLGALAPPHHAAAGEALVRLRRQPLHYIDPGDPHPYQAAKAAVADHSAHLIVVDYLQLLRRDPRDLPVSLYDEPVHITDSWHFLARATNCAVLLLTQLPHILQFGAPSLFDLGAICHSPSIVLLLAESYVDGHDAAPPTFCLHIAKNRNGPCRALALRANRDCMLYRDWDSNTDTQEN